MEILAKIFEIVNNRISLPISILCALLLFLPSNVINKIELGSFVSSNKSTIWIIFLFSTLLYLYEKAKMISSLLKSSSINFAKNLQFKKSIRDNLEGLSSQEQAWIYYCLRENKRTLTATEINPTAISLENKNLVYRPNTAYSVLSTPYTIYPEVWKYLLARKEIFCPQERLNNPQYNADVNRFISSLRNVI